MTLDLDITALLQPLPGDAPCGVSLIHDMEYDAIRAARRADGPSLPSGIWQTTLKVGDWLCGRYVDDLHPMPRDADFGFRAAPLAWIANAYSDQLSAQVELFEGRDGL